MKKTMKKLLCAVLAAATLGTCSMGVSAEESYLAGDINRDGVVNLHDSNIILMEYLKATVLGCGSTFTEEDFAIANVYSDNLLNADDADVILWYYLYIMTGGKQMTVTEFYESGLYYSEHG